MEIIARIPAVSAVEPRAREAPPPVCPVPEAATEPVQDATPEPVREAAPEPVPVRRRTSAPARHGAVVFPVRSVAVLAVLAVTAWSLALKNDAARRHAADLARAEAAKRFERIAQDIPVAETPESRAQ